MKKQLAFAKDQKKKKERQCAGHIHNSWESEAVAEADVNDCSLWGLPITEFY